MFRNCDVLVFQDGCYGLYDQLPDRWDEISRLYGGLYSVLIQCQPLAETLSSTGVEDCFGTDIPASLLLRGPVIVTAP